MSDEPVEGSLREAAARCSAARNKRVHVGTAVMPDYLNPHYDPYSSILETGPLLVLNERYTCTILCNESVVL